METITTANGIQITTTVNGVECAKIPFLWDTITAFRDQNGQIWVDVKALMSQIEISGGAVERTKEWKGFASCRKSIRLDYDIGYSHVTCLSLDCMPKWLNSLNSVFVRNRATRATALKLEQYQEHGNELVDVVRAAFYGKEVASPVVPEPVVSAPKAVATETADAPKVAASNLASSALDVRTVRFMDSDLMAARDNSGQIWAGVRWICDGIGFSDGQVDRQMKNIRKDGVLSKGVAKLPYPSKGGLQESMCMKLEVVPLWLAKINITPTMRRDTPEVARRLEEYQLKAQKVLADAFIPKELQSGKSQHDLDDDAAMAYGMMAAARKIERLEGKIAEDAPKVRFYHDVGDADGTITIEEFAKLLYARDHIDVGEHRLFGLFRKNKILTKKNLPYQKYLDNGWFVVVETPYGNHGQVRLQTRITTKGQQMLHEMFFNTDDFIEVVGDRKRKKK